MNEHIESTIKHNINLNLCTLNKCIDGGNSVHYIKLGRIEYESPTLIKPSVALNHSGDAEKWIESCEITSVH